jgi:O-antigen/teichoic acid export membrane protein
MLLRITKNASVLTMMHIINMVLGLAFTIFLARYLGDVNYGKYSFAIAFTSLFAILADLGLIQLTIRELARDREEAARFLNNALGIKLVLSLLVVAAIFISINFMNYPDDTKMAVYFIGLSVIFTSFGQLFNSVVHAYQRMEYVALLSGVINIILVAGGLTALLLGFGLTGVAMVAGLILRLMLAKRKFISDKIRFSLDFRLWKSLIKTALPFGLTTIFVILYARIDIVMLSTMKGDAVVGWYSAASRLVSGLSFIPSAFISAIFPVLSILHVSSNETLISTYEKAFKYLFIIAFPIGVGTTILADRFILLFYGEQYAHSIIALRILIWMFVIGSMAWLLGIVLQSTNRQNLFAISAGITAVFNVVANLIIIPYLSYVGASITTIASEILMVGLLFYVPRCFMWVNPAEAYQLSGKSWQ